MQTERSAAQSTPAKKGNHTMMNLKAGLMLAATLGLAACGSSDEGVVADYVAETEPKYADEANCIAEKLTADVGTDKMQKWAQKIQEDGKIGALDLQFMRGLPKAAKACLEG